jgi:hypothetical protein
MISDRNRLRLARRKHFGIGSGHWRSMHDHAPGVEIDYPVFGDGGSGTEIAFDGGIGTEGRIGNLSDQD